MTKSFATWKVDTKYIWPVETKYIWILNYKNIEYIPKKKRGSGWRNILTRTALDSVRSTWSSGPPENFPPNWINAESETFSIRASKHFSQQVQFSKSFLLKVFWTVSIFFALIFEIKKWIVNENWHPNVYKGVGLKITWICFLCSPHFLLKLKIDFLQLKGWMTLFRK